MAKTTISTTVEFVDEEILNISILLVNESAIDLNNSLPGIHRINRKNCTENIISSKISSLNILKFILDEIMLYVLIAFSIFGISVMCVVIRRFPAPPTILEQYDLDDFDEPKYAKLNKEELLSGNI